MIRCQPLLGTYVEIAISNLDCTISWREKNQAIDHAFAAIALVQKLVSFYSKESELAQINARAHLESINIHSWTYEVLETAKIICEASSGVFDCGVGAHLVRAGLLPVQNKTPTLDQCGGLNDLMLIPPHSVRSKRALMLDLGGIAKGFAVDKAIEALQAHGISSATVNAGGDLRVFGSQEKMIQIRKPSQAQECLSLGSLQNGAIATTGLYFSNAPVDDVLPSYIVNPLDAEHVQFSESYSVIAPLCIHADALTKVLAITGDTDHACFKPFSAHAIRVAA
jgi:FAD:protein FMN transferase